MLGGISKLAIAPSDHYGAGSGRVLLMRHAQTEYNAKHMMLGNSEAALTELGKEQSQRAVEALLAWQPDRIVTSPLKRCSEAIAEPLGDLLGVKPIVDERLHEFDFGPLEGLTYEQIVDRGLPFPWGPTASNWPMPEGGESLQEVIDRVASAAEDIESYPGKTAVIIHGGIIRIFMIHWFNMDMDAVNRLIVDNVTSYLFRTRPGHVSMEAFGLTPEAVPDFRG